MHVCSAVPWQRGIWWLPSCRLCCRLFLWQHSGWSGNQLAVCRPSFPAYPHLKRNARQQTRKKPFTLVRLSLRCKHRNIRSEVYEGAVQLLRLIIASLSRIICDGSKRVCYKQCGMACLYSCTMHGIPAVKLKSKWQRTVQISLNNAMMCSQNIIVACCCLPSSNVHNSSYCTTGKSRIYAGFSYFIDIQVHQILFMK